MVDQLLVEPDFSCHVARPNDKPEDTLPIYIADSSGRVSAGETITSDAGTYTTLIPFATGYVTETPLIGPFPSGLIADIPGDAFPGFSNVVIPEVAELRLRSPTVDQEFSPSMPITWEANSDGNSLMFIFARFDNQTNDEWVSATCMTEDDGSFSFSSETITELALGDSFAPSTLAIVRMAVRIEISGTTALSVINQYGESFLYYENL